VGGRVKGEVARVKGWKGEGEELCVSRELGELCLPKSKRAEMR
jgi:hypothetical protein